MQPCHKRGHVARCGAGYVCGRVMCHVVVCTLSGTLASADLRSWALQQSQTQVVRRSKVFTSAGHLRTTGCRSALTASHLKLQIRQPLQQPLQRCCARLPSGPLVPLHGRLHSCRGAGHVSSSFHGSYAGGRKRRL